MHILLAILAGFLLGGVFALFGFLWGDTPANIALAARAFIPVWLVIAAINMWVGVNRAGYSVGEELPILGVVFAVPAGAAVLFAYLVAR